jgi:hypothetical protein
MQSLEIYRAFLRTDRWQELTQIQSDQRQGLPSPPPQKACPKEATRIELVPAEDLNVGSRSVFEAIGRRKSRRRFTDEELTLEELSFLLWATQGVRHVPGGGSVIRRTVPSAGSRHPFETYLVVNRWSMPSASCTPIRDWWSRSTLPAGGSPLWARGRQSSSGRPFHIAPSGATPSYPPS